MIPPRFTQDVSHLPTHAFGHRSVTWWGVMGFIAIEGAGFLLAFSAYFFLMGQEAAWPPASDAPLLLFGTTFTLFLLLTEPLNMWIKRAAEAEDIEKVQIGLVLMSVAGALLLVVRGFEYTGLPIAWDRNAFASITWALLLIHTVHLLTDWVDTLVLTALMFTKHGASGRRFTDTAENSVYWHFVVLSWLPVYALIYWAPRLA